MPRRSYEQYCALAKALDIVGERWTLLIVRELFAGPQRFSDLLETLPGIGNGLLATRLREMQEAGLVQVSLLPPPAASRVYQLTESGRRLDEAVTALARWGASSLGPPTETRHYHPLWQLQSLAARTRRTSNAPRAPRLYIDIEVDGQRHHLRLYAGRITAGRGPHPESRACITTTGETLYALCQGAERIQDAVRKGHIRIQGGLGAARRALEALVVPGPFYGKEMP